MSVSARELGKTNRETKNLEKKKSENIPKNINQDLSSNNPTNTPFQLVKVDGIVYIKANFGGKIVFFKEDTAP